MIREGSRGAECIGYVECLEASKATGQLQDLTEVSRELAKRVDDKVECSAPHDRALAREFIRGLGPLGRVVLYGAGTFASELIPPALSSPSLSSTTAPMGRSEVSSLNCLRLSPMRVATPMKPGTAC